MKASDVINTVARQLNDAAFTRWTQADHFSYLTEGLRQCVVVQPRSYPVTDVVELAAGKTKQEIPVDGSSLIDVVRNMGADGLTPGYAVTVADRQALDASDPGWHFAAGSTSVNNYTYDDRNPLTFYVSPPTHATTKVFVEIVYAGLPEAVETMNDLLPVQDLYMGALIEYQLYRCFSVNSKSAEDRQNAQTHLGVFYAMLGEKEKAAMLISPNNPQNVVG